MPGVLYFLFLQYALVAFLTESWGLLSHPLNPSWLVICFGQENVVEEWVSPGVAWETIKTLSSFSEKAVAKEVGLGLISTCTICWSPAVS